jgi:glycosyltransferase 2 family protein
LPPRTVGRESDGVSGTLARASTAVGAGLALLAGFFVVRTLSRNWDEVRDALEQADLLGILGAFLLAGAGMTAIAFPWRRALRLLGGDLTYPEVVARYYLGEIGKYLPGGVWPVVGRGELAARAGVARTPAYGSVALSLGALYLAAMLVVLVGAPAILAGASDGSGDRDRYLWVLTLLPLGILTLHPWALERLRRLGEKLLRRPLHTTIPPWRESLALVVRYVPAWLLIGTATWAVARALGQDVGWLDVAAAAVLSWVVGFVLVPVPGGVGVREAVFIAAAGFDPGVEAAVALVARVLFVIVDGGGALAAAAWLGHRRVVGGRYAADPSS